MSTLERLGEDVSDLVAGADVFEHHLPFVFFNWG
jgi:hypothetical protein